MSLTKFDAVVSLLDGTGSVACVDADDITTFHYQGCSAPSSSNIDAELIRLQAAHDAQVYVRNRQEKYAKLNQFEMQFDDKRDGTTTWVDAIDAIKVAHPKP